MREGVLLNDIYVSGGNSATGIDIVAEVSACHRLQSLRLTEIGVATGHHSARANIANEHTHAGRGRTTKISRRIAHIRQAHRNILSVGDSGEVEDKVMSVIRVDGTATE